MQIFPPHMNFSSSNVNTKQDNIYNDLRKPAARDEQLLAMIDFRSQQPMYRGR